MEIWDLYDKDRNKLNKQVSRGDKLNDGEYHLVVNVWVKNSDNKYLITQRAEGRSYEFMWECTGGSVQAGEDSLSGAIREVEEELGIKLQKNTGKLIGSTLRYYSGCPDILDVWIFKSDISLKDVKVQEEEVNDAMWASTDEIRQMYKDGKFEANAFFEEVLDYETDEEIYYIGFNANNAICNESFFAGSITLYPTKEKGNIFYSTTVLDDTKSINFMDEYRKFIYETAKNIQDKNTNAKFICFNEKIRNLCKDMKNINIVRSNDGKLLDSLNNKFETRELVKDIIPTLDYFWCNEGEPKYEEIKEHFNSDKFVLQAETGAGGDTTYLIETEEQLNNVIEANTRYCVSKYAKNKPLNATLIIGDNDILLLPISTQLILLTDNKFKYVGGDFIDAQSLDFAIVDKINEYSKEIGKMIQSMNYRGILGIDYILCDNNELFFMEINPRFQASTFVISNYLDKYCSTNVAKLHYQAMTGGKLNKVYLESIDKSFINCNIKKDFSELNNFAIVDKGYFEKNISSLYRKLFDYSIFEKLDFEKID